MDLINAPTLTYDADRFTQSFNGTLMLRFGLRTGATRNVQKGIVRYKAGARGSIDRRYIIEHREVQANRAIWRRRRSSSPIKLNP